MRPFLWIFTISLVLRIWFNFFACQNNAAFACDASEYLRHAQNILLTFDNLVAKSPDSFHAFLDVLLGKNSIANTDLLKQIFRPLQSMSISGPVFPCFILFCYKIVGTSPVAELWAIPIAAQCILSAVTCVLIALIGSACWDKRVGNIAGICAALYPGFIINSGRLYSESFACFLLCLVIWLITAYMVNAKNNWGWGFLVGICLFALQSTRSIMSVLSIIVIAFFLLSTLLLADQRKRIAKYLIALLIGFSICLLPWMALQKVAFGKASFVVDRVGQYNFFVGNDPDGLGWLSIPYPDLSNIEKEPYTHILKRLIHKSPERFIKLLVDKPARLLKLPWNDFRAKIGPINCYTQTLFHQLVLVLAAIGAITGFSIFQNRLQKTKIVARLMILLLTLFHSVYLLFITVPRYGLTLMPEIIIFAAVGVITATNALKERSSRRTALALLLSTTVVFSISQFNLFDFINSISANITPTAFYSLMNIAAHIIALSLFLILCWKLASQSTSKSNRIYATVCIGLIALFAGPAYCLPIRANVRSDEWSKRFNHPGTKFEKTISIDTKHFDQLKAAQSYLAINLEGGSNLAQDFKISINGHMLKGPFIPAMSLAQDLTLIHRENDNYTVEQEFILKSLCSVSGQSLLDLRQWYLIPLSLQEIPLDNSSARLNICVTKSENSANTIYGAFPSNRTFSIIPSLFRFSWEKCFYGVENPDGLTDPAYDQKIETSQPANNGGPYVKLLIPTTPTVNSKIKNYKEVASNHQLKLLWSENKSEAFSGKDLKLDFTSADPQLAKRQTKSTYWLVRMTGQVDNKRSTTGGRLILWPRLNFSSHSCPPSFSSTLGYVSPWLPNELSYAPAQTGKPLQFDICFPILISGFSEPLRNIELNLHQAANKSGKAQSAETREDLHLDCSLQIYQMNKLLSGIEYEIL